MLPSLSRLSVRCEDVGVSGFESDDDDVDDAAIDIVIRSVLNFRYGVGAILVYGGATQDFPRRLLERLFPVLMDSQTIERFNIARTKLTPLVYSKLHATSFPAEEIVGFAAPPVVFKFKRKMAKEEGKELIARVETPAVVSALKAITSDGHVLLKESEQADEDEGDCLAGDYVFDEEALGIEGDENTGACYSVEDSRLQRGKTRVTRVRFVPG
tara:strand:- start:1334 stop:1972 length:639 start_codon:yes stop_codon:yes gene_type:complete